MSVDLTERQAHICLPSRSTDHAVQTAACGTCGCPAQVFRKCHPGRPAPAQRPALSRHTHTSLSWCNGAARKLIRPCGSLTVTSKVDSLSMAVLQTPSGRSRATAVAFVGVGPPVGARPPIHPSLNTETPAFAKHVDEYKQRVQASCLWSGNGPVLVRCPTAVDLQPCLALGVTGR